MDLSTALLKIDPAYTCLVRESRANLYIALNLKDCSTAHAEFKCVISEVHVDHGSNDVSYGWLAITTLSKDASLGTLLVDDVKHYFDMSIWAMARRKELYGLNKSEPPVLKKWRMPMVKPTAKNERFWLNLNSSSNIGIRILDGLLCNAEKGQAGQAVETCVSKLWQECNQGRGIKAFQVWRMPTSSLLL